MTNYIAPVVMKLDDRDDNDEQVTTEMYIEDIFPVLSANSLTLVKMQYTDRNKDIIDNF